MTLAFSDLLREIANIIMDTDTNRCRILLQNATSEDAERLVQLAEEIEESAPQEQEED